ncbi:MAG: hypothetical protein FH758_06030 [Firmicutes bacterium]|nr:hypothetical protein [Bacillota bacterium]
MKEVNYNEFKKKVKKKSISIVRSIDRTAPRRRPRDEGEELVLAKMAAKSWDDATASGRLKKVGGRQYSLKIDYE